MITVGERATREVIRLWGLTGGIGSGKSTAATFFREEGFFVIDADQIVRELSAPGGKAYPAIEARFGTNDRKKLREVIFSDKTAKSDLESILHPLLWMESWNRIHTWMTENSIPLIPPVPVIYEAALLIETGRLKDLAGLICVLAPDEDRIQRIRKRDGISQALAKKMMDAQVDNETRKKEATFILSNDSTLEKFRSEVHNVAKRIKSLI